LDTAIHVDKWRTDNLGFHYELEKQREQIKAQE
jgi:hypothetical protein